MRRFALGLLGLVLIAVLTPSLAGLLQPPPAAVYSPAAVHAALQSHPRAWIGRTVLVRGTIIAYAYDFSGLHGSHGGGQGGCFLSMRSCLRRITANLNSTIPPHSTVYLALAAQPHPFAYQGNPLSITPQHPLDTLALTFRMPLTPHDLFPPALRHWLPSASLLPPPPHGVPIAGIYRVRILGPMTPRQPWRGNAVLLDASG